MGHKPILLVVDDEPEMGESVRALFERRGFRVVVLHDGARAFERAMAMHPDAILLDLNMPGVDGWEVVRQLKNDPRTSDIPVLMMTASQVALEDAECGILMGADEYLVKPFLKQVLIHNVERLVHREAA